MQLNKHLQLCYFVLCSYIIVLFYVVLRKVFKFFDIVPFWTNQCPLQAGGVVETSSHDQERSLLIEFICNGLDLLIQR